jgi:hypothetical protein
MLTFQSSIPLLASGELLLLPLEPEFSPIDDPHTSGVDGDLDLAITGACGLVEESSELLSHCRTQRHFDYRGFGFHHCTSIALPPSAP